MEASRHIVEDFLREFRLKARLWGIFWREYEKTLKTLKEYDIPKAMMEKAILELEVQNYYQGPQSERNLPAYFTFGKKVKGVEMYIKISLGVPNHQAVCISVHPPARPIIYPYSTH